MHRLRFSHEVGGDRAEHVGSGLAEFCLPSLQESSATRHRKQRGRGLGSAKALRQGGVDDLGEDDLSDFMLLPRRHDQWTARGNR
jgi:hypothetical protein